MECVVAFAEVSLSCTTGKGSGQVLHMLSYKVRLFHKEVTTNNG